MVALNQNAVKTLFLLILHHSGRKRKVPIDLRCPFLIAIVLMFLILWIVYNNIWCTISRTGWFFQAIPSTLKFPFWYNDRSFCACMCIGLCVL